TRDAVKSAVQIDHMQPFRAGLKPALGHFERMAINGHIFYATLAQPHSLSAENVDRWVNLHKMSGPAATSKPVNPSPGPPGRPLPKGEGPPLLRSALSARASLSLRERSARRAG